MGVLEEVGTGLADQSVGVRVHGLSTHRDAPNGPSGLFVLSGLTLLEWRKGVKHSRR